MFKKIVLGLSSLTLAFSIFTASPLISKAESNSPTVKHSSLGVIGIIWKLYTSLEGKIVDTLVKVKIGKPAYGTTRKTLVSNSVPKTKKNSKGQTVKYINSIIDVSSPIFIKEDSRPEINKFFLLSVGKNQTKSITKTKTITASLKLSASVDAEVYKVVNASFGIEGSTEIKETISTNVKFKGPDSKSKFNTYNYYTSTGFDKYKITTTRYDNYRSTFGSVTTFKTTKVIYVELPKLLVYPSEKRY